MASVQINRQVLELVEEEALIRLADFLGIPGAASIRGYAKSRIKLEEEIIRRIKS